jgi:WD40 repeat protein
MEPQSRGGTKFRRMVRVAEGFRSQKWHLCCAVRRCPPRPAMKRTSFLLCGKRTNGGTVVVFDAAGAEQRRIELKDEMAALAFSADGDLLAAATIRSPVQFWDVASGKLRWTGSTDFGNTSGIRIAPDGDLIVAADGDTHVRAYDRKGKLVYTVEAVCLSHST